MVQQERTRSSVETVLQRLETYIDPEIRKIEQRVATILSLIPKVDTQRLIDSLGKLKTSGVEKEREEFENVGIAYLLSALQAKGSEKGFEIRREQIEAIVALLQKNHLQAATGFGKSSVIIPIASIIGALSENGNYAVVSVSPELKEELFNKIRNIASLLPEEIRPLLLTYKKSDSQEKPTTSLLPQDVQEERFKQMAKALIENPSLQEEINQQQRTSYFEQLLSGQPPPFQTETQETLSSLPKNTPSITLFEENDYVFYTITHQESPFAHTIFDEIHVPRSRNTVYYMSSQPSFISPQAVKIYLFKRFLAEYLKKIINQQVPLTEKKGSFWFKDEAAEKTFFEKAVFKDPNNEEIFNETVAFIAQKTGLDKEKLKQWLLGFSLKNYEDMVFEILLSLMRAKIIREGVHYQQKESQQIVRDRFMGIALPSHRFSFDIQLGLQAWQEVVSFTDYFENAAETVSFEGWVANYLRGKISGLSGTLFTPTLTDQHPRKTSLASFLEKQTGHKAILIGGEKWMTPPEPKIFQNDSSLQEVLFQQLQDDDRQTIIFCYDENEAKNLQDVLSKNFPQRSIILADASITEEEAQKRYHEFANNKNAILISTGRTGVGVDIKNSEGKHTDHKSIIYGLPWSIDQIYQALGRRRMEIKDPKKDFVWLISLNQLQKYDGFLSLENEERTKILKDLNKNPMKVIERLIKINEQSHRLSDNFLVDFDRLYQTALSLYQEKVKKIAERIFENILDRLNLKPRERTVIELFFEQIFNQSLFSFFTNFVAAPSSLYWRLRDVFSYLINPSSLGAEVIGILQSVVSEENVNDWIEAKAADFEYFLSQIILPQIRQILNFDLLLKSNYPESIRFVVGGFVLVELSELNLKKPDLEELKNKLKNLYSGLNKITLSSSHQTIYVYVDENHTPFFLLNIRSKKLITTTGEEILSTVFSSQKGPLILVIFK
jgi:superfamily II DNA/RNA helicase